MSEALYSFVLSSASPVPADVQLRADNRGLAYGDGVFETLRSVENNIPLLTEHRKRLSKGLMALKFAHIDRSLALFDRAVSDAQRFISEQSLSEALIKIIVSREAGGRGYMPLKTASAILVIQVFAPSTGVYDDYKNGVNVGVSDVVLAQQPLLAGVKHLNRLEQVLASQRLGTHQEMLLCDANNNVIEGTKTNLLVFTDTGVFTPRLDKNGVSGTLLRCLTQQTQSLGFSIKEREISLASIQASTVSLALINSAVGCWPVKTLESKPRSIDKRCRAIQVFLSETMHYPAVD